jgi:hypothetical protein
MGFVNKFDQRFTDFQKACYIINYGVKFDKRPNTSFIDSDGTTNKNEQFALLAEYLKV